MAMYAGLTIDDFEKLPDALALNHELVNGELVEVSGNTPEHNRLRDLLVHQLMQATEDSELGLILAEQEYDFGGNAHGPDVSFVSAPRRRLIEWKLRVQRFTPDLAIEVVSRNDTYEALVGKARRYLQYGTKEVWVFSIGLRQALRLSELGHAFLDENAEFAPRQIPGFSIRIGELLDRI